LTQSEIRVVTSDSGTVSYASEKRRSIAMFACNKCQKREFQITQLSEMRLLAECAGCGASFVVDSVSEKKSWVEATDPNQHLVWNWKNEQWVPAKRA